MTKVWDLNNGLRLEFIIKHGNVAKGIYNGIFGRVTNQMEYS